MTSPSFSQEAVLTQQLVLPRAEQNLRDTQGQLSQGSVALIQSLGGGWQATGTERLGSTMQYPGLRAIGYYQQLPAGGPETIQGKLVTQLNRCLVELADGFHIETVKVLLAVGGA